jgi:hypothetical protein
MFERCFVDGHREPGVRPSAWDWHHALKQSEHQLQNCEANQHHLYSGHLDRCPWCVRLSARVNSNTQPSGNTTPSDWRLKSSSATGGRTSGSSLLLGGHDPLVGRWMSPANTRLGVDFLVIIIIGLIAAAGMLYAITGWNSAASPAYFSSTARDLWAAGVEKLNIPEWKIPDLAAPASFGSQAIDFQSLILCQEVDRLQRPVGAGSSFTQANIRDTGLGAYVKYSAPRGAKADISIKWSSRAGSGASGPHPLPSVGPFFVKLGQDFPPGSYNFSLVVDGVSIQSERVTIR